MPEAKFVRGVKCCHWAGNIKDHYFLLSLKNGCFFLRVLPTLSCHRSNRVNVPCEGCGMANRVPFLGAKERWRALGSPQFCATQSPFPSHFHWSPDYFQEELCIPWHGKEEEERLVSWGLQLLWPSWPLLTPLILVLAHPAKHQRFGVIGSEREANLVYSVYFMERSWNQWFELYLKLVI